MKGLPKVRLSKKLGIILGGVVVLTGTTGAAAVYIGADTLLGPSYEQLNGLECTEVNTVTIKKKDRFWVRKYITTEPTDGVTRVKTALRVAKAIHEAEHPDLVQVVVLDKNAPAGRTELRGRAIGADVIYIADPARVPEEAQAGPYAARYVDKLANATGQFYGEKINLPIEDIEQLLARLDDATDCVKPVVEAPADAHGAPSGHGEKAPKSHGAAPKGHGEASGHDAAPADGHGAAPADGHGAAPAAEGHGEETPVAEGASESKGWMASVMGMVGLGGGEAPAPEAHAAAEDGTAAAGEHGEAAKPASHGETASAAGHESAAPTVAHGDAAPVKGNSAEKPAAEHAAAPEAATAEAEPEGKGWFASVKSMVGLGGDEAPAVASDVAPAAAHGDAASAAKPGGADAAGNPVASKADAHGGPAAASHETAKDIPVEPVPAESPKNSAASAAGADWLAKHRSKPVAGDAAKATAANGSAGEPPAEDSDVLPPKASDKVKAKASGDQAAASH